MRLSNAVVVLALLLTKALAGLFEIELPRLYAGSIVLSATTQKGYLTVEETMYLLAEWTTKNPQLVVPAFEVGRSSRGNPIMMVGITKIRDKSIGNLKKYPGILLNSLMHAREKSSLTMLLAVFLDVLSQSHESDALNYQLETSVVWFLPFVNIDAVLRMEELWKEGYHYIDAKVEYRKNLNFNASSTCHTEIEAGVDINRNFESQFGSLGIINACAEQYPGPKAFSEPETQVFKTIFKDYRLTLAIDIHTFGNSWVYPFSYDRTGLVLKRNNTQAHFYRHVKKYFDSIGQKLETCFGALGYVADGVYIDWALQQNVFSFVFEVANNFSEPMDTLDKSIQGALPPMRHLLLRNSYNVAIKCITRKKEAIEVTLESNSLVELELEVQSMLYWFKISVVSLENSSRVLLPPLHYVTIGLPLITNFVVLQLRTPYGDATNNQSSIYTTSLDIGEQSEECSSELLSDNLVIAIVVGLFLLCMLACILLSCMVKDASGNKPAKIRYDVVEPETSEAV